MNGRVVTWIWITVASLVAMLLIVACGATPEPAAVEPTEPPPTPAAVEPTEVPSTPTAVEPTQPPAPTEAPPTLTAIEPTEPPATPTAVEPTQPPAATEVASLPTTPDPVIGQQLWQQKPCAGCHGTNARGGIGPRLAGTGLSFDQVLLQVRTGADPMPAFTEDEVSDLEVQHIYAWLRSLTLPTPTPMAAPVLRSRKLAAKSRPILSFMPSHELQPPHLPATAGDRRSA
jgi:mono/diheme cytochrome c family protein